MTTVVNTPPTATDSGGGGMGMVIGIVIVILVIVLLIIFGLPALRGGTAPAADTSVPNGGDVGNEVQLPEQVDVNVNSGGGQP